MTEVEGWIIGWEGFSACSSWVGCLYTTWCRCAAELVFCERNIWHSKVDFPQNVLSQPQKGHVIFLPSCIWVFQMIKEILQIYKCSLTKLKLTNQCRFLWYLCLLWSLYRWDLKAKYVLSEREHAKTPQLKGQCRARLKFHMSKSYYTFTLSATLFAVAHFWTVKYNKNALSRTNHNFK